MRSDQFLKTGSSRSWPTGVILSTMMVIVLAMPVCAAASMELYGTFNAMGVVVTVAGADDPNENAVAAVEYRVAGSGTFRLGLSLSRVSPTSFIGSLFALEPGTNYEVRVTFTDPDHGPLDGTSLSATGATRAEIVIPRAQRTLYVSPAGSGDAFSYTQPGNLTEAINQVQPGDEVLLRGGVYFMGEIDLLNSGCADAPIVIRSFPGERAVLDGADPANFTWTSQGGGVYATTVNQPDPHLVLAGGERLFPYPSRADLNSLRWSVPGLYAEGRTLFVRLAGDADPNHLTMIVSRYNYAFDVEQNFIYFTDLTFRYYGCGEWSKTVYFLDGSDNLVQGCTFAFCDVGVGLKYNSHRNVIQDCEFYDRVFEWPWDGVKEIGTIEDGGVVVYTLCTGRGTVIRRNVFHDDFDGMHVCTEVEDPAHIDLPTSEIDVYENVVYRVGDDCMETDGYASNVRIWGNVFHDCLGGISLAPCYTGPVYAQHNLIYLTGRGTTSEPVGMAFKFNSGYDPSGPLYLFHNTADTVTPGISCLPIYEPGDWKLLSTRNNIWAGTLYALEVYNTKQPFDLDYDDLYTSQSGELVWWDGLPESHLHTLAEFQAATGQEMHGASAIPGFTNVTAGDYRLAAGSLLIDRGVVIPGINNDFSGSAPDQGAFESQPRPGDLNADAGINSFDVQWLRRYLTGNRCRIPAGTDVADLNGDGRVDAADLILLQRMAG